MVVAAISLSRTVNSTAVGEQAPALQKPEPMSREQAVLSGAVWHRLPQAFTTWQEAQATGVQPEPLQQGVPQALSMPQVMPLQLDEQTRSGAASGTTV